jgi:serine/threonine protein kinase
MTYNLILLGVPSSLINSEKSKQNYTSVLYTIAANYMHKYRNTNITYLSTGSEAVIVFDNETKIALKFALAIGAEYNIAKKIINGKNKLPKNVFKCLLNSELENITSNKEDDIREIRLNGKMFIPMEYIKGNSLEQAIVQKGNLEPIKIYKYSAGIMNGLIEMRTARVFYHRDIRPANIMIDEENDRAVIVDLGIATTDKSALSKDNRRFGSVKGKIANDLVSLGQVMYYMATGKHIFEQSESMTRTFSDVAEEIEDYRTKVYSDETGELLKEHLKQVDSEIADEKLRELTIACLTAKHYQYNKINKMFKEYAK